MQPISLRSLFALMLVAGAISVFSAKPYAGGWNDGSRLATVESLVDYHTLSIDQSIFANPSSPNRPSPYPSHDELLMGLGTLDKMYIDGHYYSDKSPVPAVLMAGVYQVWRWLGGPSAAEHPDRFCLLMTLSSSGLAYVVAACCLFVMGLRIGLSQRWSLLLTVVFGLGTVSIAYVQHVNNHILLLGVAMALFLALLHGCGEPPSLARTALIGCFAGLAYAIDLGAGPPLFVIAGLLVLFETRGAQRGWRSAGLVFSLAALPWVLLHHVLNYAIGGTIGPANAIPEYFNWPGSPFHASNMTGGWNHTSILKAIAYALDMLFGKRGFLGHDLPLLLLLPLMLWLLRGSYREKPIVVAGLIWALGTWLLYAATSRNMSGLCCSVRWLVPLLAPGFLALAICLRDAPRYRMDFLILSGWAVLMGVGMAIKGPWTGRMIPFYWSIYGGCLTFWGIWSWARHRRNRKEPIGQVVGWRIALGRAQMQKSLPEDKLDSVAQDSLLPNE